MKKFFAVFLMSLVLAVFALPVLAAAVQPPEGYGLPATSPISTGANLITFIETLTNWVFAIFVVLTVVFVLLAAFQFVTAGGDEAKVGEARMKLIWAFVGIIVAFIAKGIVPVVRIIVGG